MWSNSSFHLESQRRPSSQMNAQRAPSRFQTKLRRSIGRARSCWRWAAARRAEADGWLIKPLDSFRLRRAVQTVLSTGSYTEGVPDEWKDVAPLLNH